REVAVQRIGAAFVLFSTRPDASTSDRTENRAGQAGTATRRGTAIDSLRVVAARFRSRRVPHTSRPKQLGSQNWRNELRPVAATRELHHIGRALEKLLHAPPQPWAHQLRDPARYQDHPAQRKIGETAHVSGRAQGRIRRSRFCERTGWQPALLSCNRQFVRASGHEEAEGRLGRVAFRSWNGRTLAR